MLFGGSLASLAWGGGMRLPGVVGPVQGECSRQVCACATVACTHERQQQQQQARQDTWNCTPTC